MIHFTAVAVILASVASKALAESGGLSNPVYLWPAETTCPDSTDIEQEACWDALSFLFNTEPELIELFDGKTKGPGGGDGLYVHGWDWTPCGCFFYYSGDKYFLDYNTFTGTGNCGTPHERAFPVCTVPHEGNIDHWEINTLNTSIVEDEGPRIKVEFNISNRVYSTQVLQDDCERNFTGVAASGISFIDTPLSSSVDDFVQYDTLIKLNHSAFVDDGAYWNSISDTLGFIEICVLTKLYLSGTVETVNFLSNVINVTIDTDGNFEVSNINATRTSAEESEVAVDYSTYIEAYQCLPEDLTQKNTRVYNQGSVLVVCVKGDGDIVAVETIKQLSVNQGSNLPFEYISEANGYNAAIVQVECEDDNSNRICSAQLRLLGRFFTSENPENLQVTGSVTMTFPSNRRRLSHPTFVQGKYNDLKSSRFLQDISDTGAFNIVAELEKIDDSVNNPTILSGNMNYHFSSVALYYVFGLVWYIM